MNNRLKIGLVLAILIAAALIAAFWATTILSQPPNFQTRRAPPIGGVAGDLEYFYLVFSIISTINIALLVIVLITYLNIYSKTRSSFTVGLIIFALAFLVKDLLASPFVTGLFSFQVYGLGPFVFLPDLFEMAALSVLLYLSLKY